ncbi:MarR family winged helix-turn-helix transcriptional regulator [Peterkaempfera bronchialis]|uniref:MarR family winged helix-turn-helix transcriptional regulator n=1 Tax=Peterkaempfera bronchialis TaxID=2126346 RepID=UPI003C2EEE5B
MTDQHPGSRSAPLTSPDEVATALLTAVESLVVLWGRAHQAPGTTVSTSQLRALITIDRHRRIHLRGLAEELGAAASVTSRICDRLQTAGLIDRDVGEADRRQVILRLTREGAELLAELRERRRAGLRATLAGMAPAARASLLVGLEEYHRAAEPVAQPVAPPVAQPVAQPAAQPVAPTGHDAAPAG